MREYDVFVFVLCFIVFVMFTSVFSYVIIQITKMRLKLIKHGIEDEEIIIEKQKKAKTNRFVAIFSNAVSLLLCLNPDKFSTQEYLQYNELRVSSCLLEYSGNFHYEYQK